MLVKDIQSGAKPVLSMIKEELTLFLKWMAKNKMDSVISFFVYQDGRNGKTPHWTNGKHLYNADELVTEYMKFKEKQRR